MLSDRDMQRLKEKIEKIKKAIARIGHLRPGTLYERHSICGKPGCCCIRTKKPIRHGPYYYLSYTFNGRSYTEFVPHQKLKSVREEVRNYNKFMSLVKMLIDYSIKLARLRKNKKESKEQ